VTATTSWGDAVRRRSAAAMALSLCLSALAAAAVEPESEPETTPAPDPDATLSTPLSGWRYHGLTDDAGEARVAYPTPPIDRGGQRQRTIIEGRLRADAERPGRRTLAVNGNPLPLVTDGDGRFARPYAFGAGSNSIQLTDDSGVRSRRQFYEANALRTPARIRIVLGWDDPGAEVDLHVISPDGKHAYWADPVMGNGGGLDVDSVDGPGPEMFTMTAPMHGAYAIYVNYWGNLGAGGYDFDDASNSRDLITTEVTLVFNENTLNERRETFVIPLRTIGELQLIKAFRY